MTKGSWWVIAGLAIVYLSGCLGSAPAPTELPTLPLRLSVLEGAIEPLGLVAPTFRISAVASGIRGGEPSVWAHTNGTLYASFPGCTEETQGCGNGPVLRSDDQGATWKLLNDPETGLLTDENRAANGDADVTVDANGTVYASDLGRGIPVFRSEDAGETWQDAGNPTKGIGTDRQWMAAADAGHMILAWIDPNDRSVHVTTTWDGGRHWGAHANYGYLVGMPGPVHFDPSGTRAFIPFTVTQSPVPVPNPVDGWGFIFYPDCKLMVWTSLDGGKKWEAKDTGVMLHKSLTGTHWPCGLIFPVVDVTGDGHVVVAYAEETRDPVGATNSGSQVRMIASADWGQTWSKPLDLSPPGVAVMPWVTGGAGDRAAITYLASDAQGDPDRTDTTWNVMATIVDGVGNPSPKMVTSVIAPETHKGRVCTTGSLCTLSDRSLLDFFESDLTPEGNLVAIFPVNHPAGTSEIRFAMQNGGTPLLVPGPS